MRAVYTNSLPTSVNTFNVPIGKSLDDVPFRYQTHDRLQNLYVQDKWTPTKKLVLNLGVRISKDRGWMDASCQPATAFVEAQCFPVVDNAPNLKNVAPRFSAVYDLNGDGRTALKFGANRYNTPIVLSYVDRINPVITASDTRPWTVCAAGQATGCDLNGDRIPQLNELGPSNGYGAGLTTRYGNVKVPLADEYTFEVQRQLPGNMVATVGYSYRKKFNQLVQRNMLVPKESYIPLTVTEKNSGKTVTVYNQAPGLRGLNDSVFYSDPAGDTIYKGADVSVNKRMSNRWSLMGGATFGKTTGDPVGAVAATADLNNPTNDSFRTGIVGNDVPWSSRLSGVYELPYRFSLSGTASYYAGFPEATTVLVNSATVALTQGSQTVWVSRRGDTRLPSVFQLDMAIRRSFRVSGRSTVEPRIDIYNVTNGSTILGRVTQLGSAYLSPSTIMRGRLIKLGGNVTF
jgi:hypothetical protein